MTKKLLLSFLFFATIAMQVVMAQTKTVRGRILDSDGVPIPGVTVFIEGTTNGTTTDDRGNYEISASDNDVLVYQSVGLTTQKVRVGAQSNIDVSMQDQELSEVVVVAYGTADRSSITNSVTSVSSEQIKNLPILGVEQALQGRATGVQITQNSGSPGGGIAVRVRGASSISASNEPLYVIDGVPINTGSYSAIGVGNQQANALANLNPSEIESIEVLKDAASASLYGSRGANGVVLITTKRGKAGKTQINFGYYGGFQDTWRRLNPLTGQQYIELLTDQVVNRFGTGVVPPATATAPFSTTNPIGRANSDGTVTVNSGSVFLGGSTPVVFRSPADLAAWYYTLNSNITGSGTAASPFTTVRLGTTVNDVNDVGHYLNPSTAPNTNWQSEIFRTAPIHNWDLSVQGGNERTQFAVSGTYFKQQGIILGSEFNRFNGRINLDHSINKNFKVGLSTSFSRAVNSRINNDNNIFGVLSAAILNGSHVPVRTSTGVYAFDNASSTDNPVAQALEPTNISITNRLINNVFAEYQIIPGLKFRMNWGVDYLYFREDRFIPTTTRQGLASNGAGDANTVQDVNWINENILTYSKSINDMHNLDFLLGMSFQQSNQEGIVASGTGFPGNDIRRLSAAAVKTNASSSGTSWALNSYFFRANYNFQNKYFFSASARVDGSSRFAANNRYGFFPAVSAGWRIGEESFLDGLDFISELKLRASYGLTGNQEIGNFSSLSLFGAGANYLQVGGFVATQLPNENLKWETTTQTDIGLDIGFLKNRINVVIDAYLKQTNDLLLNTPIPATSGFTTFLFNVGSIENRGLEIGVNAVILEPETEDGFRWSSDFNIAFNQNKVTKLADNVPPFASGFANWVEVGQPLGTFRGFVAEGIFQTNEEIVTLNTQVAALGVAGVTSYQGTAARAGDIKFKDLDGNGYLNSNDQTFIGSAQPDFFGGWTNNFSYKGFDLSIFMQFVYGNEIYNNTRAFAEGMNGVFGQTDATLNRWTFSNTNTDMPRAVLGDPNNNRRVSTRWVEDGSFLRLKNVVLGYNFPSSITKRLSISSLRVYASAQNLLTFTRYKGFDPEVNTFSGSNTALGTDFLTFPQARTFTFGINVGF
ncbi:MAG: TonB-dependent receptor [Cytophagales bacterium]|nr:MAG: TonB-dependent receptor [Cytophagales bacterium]